MKSYGELRCHLKISIDFCLSKRLMCGELCLYPLLVVECWCLVEDIDSFIYLRRFRRNQKGKKKKGKVRRPQVNVPKPVTLDVLQHGSQHCLDHRNPSAKVEHRLVRCHTLHLRQGRRVALSLTLTPYVILKSKSRVREHTPRSRRSNFQSFKFFFGFLTDWP